MYQGVILKWHNYHTVYTRRFRLGQARDCNWGSIGDKGIRKTPFILEGVDSFQSDMVSLCNTMITVEMYARCFS